MKIYFEQSLMLLAGVVLFASFYAASTVYNNSAIGELQAQRGFDQALVWIL